ncbi:uncharacterized protein LOC105422760 [Pogonomyrmex barbatus]|uniref:Uncharacterized protein LOC105422760 n=1 Tax=Pogonomyrmex barbatus TaxID=144034 RepID=A0A6I9VPG3_9HYME|nr:uncharacterized protein LOC105422760 [Pogonomyrmex barbatus]
MRIASVMMLLMWRRAGQATPDSRHNLDWELFSHQPGIYYEEIGQLRQAESAWKLVIKLSAKELDQTSAIARLYGGNRNTVPKSNRQRPVRLPKHYEDNRKKKHQIDHAVDTSRNAIQND